MVIGHVYRKQTLLLIHLYCTLCYPWHLHSITQWRGSTWVTIHNRERQIPLLKLIRQWYIELHVLFIVQKLIVPTRNIVVVYWIPCCITTYLTWDLTIAEKKVQVALAQGKALFHAVTDVCTFNSCLQWSADAWQHMVCIGLYNYTRILIGSNKNSKKF